MANRLPNSFKAMLFKGQITSLADTFKIILMKDGFVFDVDTHHAYADVLANEIENGLGYTTGGLTLTGVSVSVYNTNNTAVLLWNFAEWIATGGSLIASGAVVYDDSTTTGDDYTDAIASYVDFGGTITTANGLLLRVYTPNITM